MVGGLADWFAVTALFRHPLGSADPAHGDHPHPQERHRREPRRFRAGELPRRRPARRAHAPVRPRRTCRSMAHRPRQRPTPRRPDIVADRGRHRGAARRRRCGRPRGRRDPPPRDRRPLADPRPRGRHRRRGAPPPGRARCRPARTRQSPRREHRAPAPPAARRIAVVGARGHRRPGLRQDQQRRPQLGRRHPRESGPRATRARRRSHE